MSTHNLTKIDVQRKNGDPLVCPELTVMFPVGVKPPVVAGGNPSIQLHAVPVQCMGSDCAKWDRQRDRPGCRVYGAGETTPTPNQAVWPNAGVSHCDCGPTKQRVHPTERLCLFCTRPIKPETQPT